jgi:hypothetical protein
MLNPTVDDRRTRQANDAREVQESMSTPHDQQDSAITESGAKVGRLIKNSPRNFAGRVLGR